MLAYSELRRQSRLLSEAAKLQSDPEFRRALAAGAFALAQQAEAMERAGTAVLPECLPGEA